MRETSGRKTYTFDQNPEWVETKAKLDKIESDLIRASDARANGECLVNDVTGEILPTVTITL